MHNFWEYKYMYIKFKLCIHGKPVFFLMSWQDAEKERISGERDRQRALATERKQKELEEKERVRELQENLAMREEEKRCVLVEEAIKEKERYSIYIYSYIMCLLDS